MTISIVFLVLALVCFLCATAGVPSNINLGWLGMAFLVIMRLIGG